tara:strand:+ start:147 stop:341 length:195 start_codon:yes stop_codon:yes gene_type:complete
MIKIGDRVAPFTNMSREGVVVQMEEVPVNTWFVGGSASTTFQVHVKLDSGGLARFHIEDLMRLE